MTSKKAHRLARLVGLQRADQAQLQRPPALAPAGHRLLHPVLAEHPLAGRQHRRDALPGLLLGDRDQGDLGRIAAGGLRRAGDPGQNGGPGRRSRIEFRLRH